MKALKTLWNGVDTAKVGYLVEWPPAFQSRLTEFRRAREMAQQAAGRGFCHYYPLVPGAQEFIVRPAGARMLPFAFEAGGILIFIGNTLAPWESGKSITPNVRVEFQPWAVARAGLPDVHAYVFKLLAQMGGTCVGNLLSEVHMTADIETDRPHRPSDYHAHIDALWSKVRTRVRSNGQFHDVTTDDMGMHTNGKKLKQVNIGKDKKMLRIYDKMLELQTHHDKIFEAFLWQSPRHIDFLGNMPGAEAPDTAVMRVEFQLRRERLLEWHISSVEDFLTNQTALWAHLTGDFVVLIENDDSNRTRCSTQEWWKHVQQAWGEPTAAGLRKRVRTLPDPRKYSDQAMGLMTAMGARMGDVEHIELSQITDAIQSDWEATHPDSWRKRMIQKRLELETRWADLLESTDPVSSEVPSVP